MTSKKGPPDLHSATGKSETSVSNTTLSIGNVQEQIKTFAEALFEPNDLIEVRLIPSKHSRWVEADKLPSLASELLSENDRGQHVFVGLNPRKRNALICLIGYEDIVNVTNSQPYY